MTVFLHSAFLLVGFMAGMLCMACVDPASLKRWRGVPVSGGRAFLYREALTLLRELVSLERSRLHDRTLALDVERLASRAERLLRLAEKA
jgi:hypothetical protein